MRESTPRQVDKKSGGPQGGPKILKGSKILKEEERTNSFSLLYALVLYNNMGFPGGSDGKASVCNVGDIRWNIEKAREFQKNIYFCFIDYAKALTVWITVNCGKFWNRWEYQTTWPASWETCMQVRKQQLELDMEQQTGSK